MNKIKIGDTIVMPTPNKKDAWSHGNFLAVVNDILKNGNLIVEDQESDFWEVEPDRVELYKEEI